MSNINLDRFNESTGLVRGDEIRSALRKAAYKSSYHFVEKYEKEYTKKGEMWLAVYNSEIPYTEQSKMLRLVERAYNPKYLHPIEYFFVDIPDKILHWLICGPNWHYDKQMKQWIWIDGYHLMSKLCRYQTWKHVHITAWDRLRFRLVTGYKFER